MTTRAFQKAAVSILCLCAFVCSASADVIVDNGGPGTSYTGVWSISGGPNPYGASSLYSYGNGTYTWQMQQGAAGKYEIYMWWTAATSRTKDAVVTITDSNGTAYVHVNQQINASMWNDLGQYQLDPNSGLATVMITAAPGSTISTCADAVKFVPVSELPPPSVIIDNGGPGTSYTGVWSLSGGPNPYGGSSLYSYGNGTYTWQMQQGQAGTYDISMWWTAATSRTNNAMVTITDSNGTAQVYVNQQVNPAMWNSLGQYNLDPNSGAASVMITAAPGSTISTCADAVRFTPVTQATPPPPPPPSGSEQIYVARIYAWNYLFLPQMTTMLNGLKATSDVNGTNWHYTNPTSGKSFDIHFIDTKDALMSLLMTDGAHIVTSGHSNYGLGPAFTTAADGRTKKISDCYYVNDARFLNVCSDIAYVSAEGEVYGQMYPNWKPIYSNGASALAPGDPSQGLPPYNYYIGYYLPNDPTHYKVQFTDGNTCQRFSDSGCPAWFSSTGAKPDPNVNPEYFMMYPFADWNRFSIVSGSWSVAAPADGNLYAGYNYYYRPAGTGTSKAAYNMVVLAPGRYEVRATWPALSNNAKNAPYTINYAQGSAVVMADQTKSVSYGLSKWNVLGQYSFNKGSYTITLSDTASGQVCADAIELYPLDNPTNIVQAEFGVDKLSGSAPLTVNFTDYSVAQQGIKSRAWNFGDGSTDSSANPSHTYTKAGVYTVSLTVNDSKNGSNTIVKQSLIIAGNYTPSVNAQFAAATRLGNGKVIVYFKNQCSATITSWLWAFGDGTTSTLSNPSHVYYTPGAYTVSLTVSGPSGTSMLTQGQYINVMMTPAFCDNTTLYRPMTVSTSMSPHSSGKIALNMADYRMKPEQMKFARLFWATCNSGPYFLDTFQHGIVFCTTSDVEMYTAVQYLEYYLQGYSDTDILTKLNTLAPIHAMVDFSKKPK
jgi:PKD repeat protein